MATRKKVIPKKLREMVWLTYCGKNFEANCHLECGSRITVFTYECGHVLAEHRGGDLHIDNLRPICSACNRSMGTKHMYDEFAINFWPRCYGCNSSYPGSKLLTGKCYACTRK